jgi:hypothetical protein
MARRQLLLDTRCRTDIRREEGPTMGDPQPMTGDSDMAASGQPGTLDDAREAALIQEVIRAQERHREGGVEPALARPDANPEPEA